MALVLPHAQPGAVAPGAEPGMAPWPPAPL